MKVNWFREYLRNLSIMQNSEEYARHKNILFSFYPFSGPYTSSLNPIFVSSQVNQQKTCMARDGILLLSSMKEDIQLQVCIDKDLSRFIRTRQVYEIVSKNSFSSERLPEFLILSVAVSSLHLNLDDVDEELEKLKKIFGGKLRKIKVLLYAPCLPSPQGGYEDKFHLQFFLKMKKFFGKNLIQVSKKELEMVHDMRDYAYFEINPKRVYADSAFQHFCLARGAGLCRFHQLLSPSDLPLSLFHSVRLSKPFEGSPQEKKLVDFSKKKAQALIGLP
jgi:hypothetical protein